MWPITGISVDCQEHQVLNSTDIYKPNTHAIKNINHTSAIDYAFIKLPIVLFSLWHVNHFGREVCVVQCILIFDFGILMDLIQNIFSLLSTMG